jgi:hypothetical protein
MTLSNAAPGSIGLGLQRVLSWALALAALAAAGCGDPVRDNIRDSLGGETPGVRRGPNHRPGQPCLVCHDGGEAPEFSIAGTLYLTPTSAQPLIGGRVVIVDAAGTTFTTTANCAGNFYASPKTFTPEYPFSVSISYGEETVTMQSLVRREGSCAACHTDPAGPSSAGKVFLTDLPNPPAVQGCP